ncbi:MAG TPA: acetyl-CoA carboxylase biotin carboxyl carrier protein, partial [Thermoanaerobaculia bacterium]|nr:acetyl-CoA carboxylase biotin carboxyl carrier protein [Thermoanaerobaculia bacterium]
MAFLTFKEILELLDRVADRGIGAVEVESAGLRVRIEGKKAEPPAPVYAAPVAMPGTAQVVSAPQPAPGPAPEPVESDEGLHIVTSPIVGTFYRSPNPEAEPFINIGDRIGKGDVLCIVEAMKLMNEIESDVEGIVARIYPQNGQPIEYGEKLFAV